MKKLLSFMLILILVLSLSLGNVYAVSNKASSTTIEYLATKSDDEIVLVSFYIETNIKILDLWEYSRLKNYDISKYDLDYEYFSECYKDYKQYEREQTNLKNELMLDFYYNKLNGTEDNFINCYPYLEMMQAYMLVSDIHKLDTLSEVTSYSVSDNSVNGGVDSESEPLTEFCKNVYIDKKLNNVINDEIDNIEIFFYGISESYYLFKGTHTVGSDVYCEEILGDYIVGSFDSYSSEGNKTAIYVTNEKGDLWTISEAFNNNLIDMGNIATILPYVYLIGDADYDREITIKDATTIQKILAGLEGYKDVVCGTRPEDKDLDGDVTIKDATAIQKYIAGLEY